MPVTSGSVLLRASTHLNDPLQAIWTEAIMLPFMKMAINELEEEMSVFELTPLIQDSAILPVASGSTTLAGLPSDFIEAISMIERAQGATDNEWMDVPETKDMDNNLVVRPVTYIGEWAIRNTTILINPPTENREVTLSYIRGLVEPTTGNNIDIVSAQWLLGLLTAKNAARDAGNSPTKAASFDSDITRARDRLIRRLQKNNQSVMGARRLPYRGKG